MEIKDKVKEWLIEEDYSEARKGRVLLSVLLADFIRWCNNKGNESCVITNRMLVGILSELGYDKVRSNGGVYFIMTK